MNEKQKGGSKMFKRIRSERGFTLVELLVVLAVLAILIAIVVPNLAGITGGARRSAAETELDTVQSAMDSMMSKYEAISVAARADQGTITLGSELTIWKIIGYDPESGEDTTTSSQVDWLLRSTTHGEYTWDDEGTVSQEKYD
jgi:type IV pilus assembly protein PilA